MSKFWFSRNNLVRTIRNIMALFSAADADMDAFEKIVYAHNLKILEMEQRLQTLQENAMILFPTNIQDSSSGDILDSRGSEILSAVHLPADDAFALLSAIQNAHTTQLSELEQTIQTVADTAPVWYVSNIQDSSSEGLLDDAGNAIRSTVRLRAIAEDSSSGLYLSKDPDYDVS